MAKSTRSKVKRSYRAKKRDEGVYAAIEAARLARLSAKLKAVASLPADDEEGDDADAEGDEVMEDADAEAGEGAEVEKTEGKGWCRDSDSGCFDFELGREFGSFDIAAFGLLGVEEITSEGMERFCADDGIRARKDASIVMQAMAMDEGSPSSSPSTSSANGTNQAGAAAGARRCRRVKSSNTMKSCH